MEQWDQEFIDAEGLGFIHFDLDGGGEVHFGYVHGNMDCEQVEWGNKPAVEWSWYGNDEMHEASGRGRALLQSDGTLHGKIVFHRARSPRFAGSDYFQNVVIERFD